MKFNYQYYKPHKEFEKDGNYVYLYSDDDLYERQITVDEDNNILSDEETGSCGCRSCVENS